MSMARLAMCANRINERYPDCSLLDVGCRTMDLKPLLSSCSDYVGTDLIPADGVIPCDLEKPLPMKDNSYDVVTVLDVLEHLNNPHGTLRELCRVARKAVFVSLPNMYYIQFRWNFFRGRGISAKYAFLPEPVLDRHRWVLSYSEAMRFVEQNAEGFAVEHQMILPERGRTRFFSSPVERFLGCCWPNLFAYGLLSEIIIAE